MILRMNKDHVKMRHASIGNGKIGEELLLKCISYCNSKNIPCVNE